MRTLSHSCSGVAAALFAMSFADAKPAAATLDVACNRQAQQAFKAGLTMLHSFEYREARADFERAAARDSDCAIALWGEAMTYWHPLWAPPSKADLQAGAAILEKAAATGPRREMLVEALSTFFSSDDPATHQDRARAYERQMQAIHLALPQEPEIALFYALSLLATADPHDKTYAQQYRAAAVVNLVGQKHPDHPGVLHYAIHAFDYPGLAYLALPAALRYADAAPNSAHAQHMPSHIFARLGMWEEAIRSNEDSTRSAEEYTHRAHLAGHYDEGLHSIDYLVYALLQVGRDADAARVLAELRTLDEPSEDNFKAAFTYASSPARYALERKAWQEAQQLEIAPAAFPWAQFPWAESITHFARGIGAAKSGNIATATAERDAIDEINASLAPTTLPYWREQVSVQRDLVSAAIAFAQGDKDAALALANAAADREDVVDKHPVTPGEVYPAREFYADMLLEAGRADAALGHYVAALSRSPRRLNPMVGVARAAAALGDAQRSDLQWAFIRNQAKNGDRRFDNP